MALRFQISWDCRNAHMLAAWWAARLGYVVEDHHEIVHGLLDDGSLTADDVVTIEGRLAFASVAAARDPDGVAPRLYFAAVPEGKAAKNRLHLDIPYGTRDLDDMIAEYVEAGASFTTFGGHPGHKWAVMADPEGNEFCLH